MKHVKLRSRCIYTSLIVAATTTTSIVAHSNGIFWLIKSEKHRSSLSLSLSLFLTPSGAHWKTSSFPCLMLIGYFLVYLCQKMRNANYISAIPSTLFWLHDAWDRQRRQLHSPTPYWLATTFFFLSCQCDVLCLSIRAINKIAPNTTRTFQTAFFFRFVSFRSLRDFDDTINK